MRSFFIKIQEFFAKPARYFFILLFLLFLFVGIEFICTPTVKKGFTFESIHSNGFVYEKRSLLLPRGQELAREQSLYLYISEYLLGPFSLDARPLFNLNTRVETVIFRKGKLWIDLSSEAAVPLTGVSSLPFALTTLERNIKQHFSGVKDLRLTIAGKVPFH